jgi:hypothetical protein
MRRIPIFDPHSPRIYHKPLRKFSAVCDPGSTHYSSADVDRCLTAMEALNDEVEALLTKGSPHP